VFISFQFLFYTFAPHRHSLWCKFFITQLEFHLKITAEMQYQIMNSTGGIKSSGKVHEKIY